MVVASLLCILAYYAAHAAGVDPREYSRQYEAKLRQAEVASIQVHAKHRQAGGGGGLPWPSRLVGAHAAAPNVH